MRSLCLFSPADVTAPPTQTRNYLRAPFCALLYTSYLLLFLTFSLNSLPYFLYIRILFISGNHVPEQSFVYFLRQSRVERIKRNLIFFSLHIPLHKKNPPRCHISD